MSKPVRKRPVYVAISNGWMVRNYVYSGLLARLTDSCSVTVLVKEGSVLDADRRWLMGCETADVLQIRVEESRLKSTVRRTKKFLFEAGHRLSTPLERYERRLHRNASKHLLRLVYKSISIFPTRGTVRQLDRLETRLTKVHGLPESIAKDAIAFCPNIALDWDASVARQMTHAGVTVVGAVASWDHLSSKGVLPLGVKNYLAWSQGQANEVKRLYGALCDPDVAVVGAPQFDVYSSGVKEKYRRKSNDPLIIAYFTSSPRSVSGEPDLLIRFAEYLETLPFQAKLVVRCHPFDRSERYRKLCDLGIEVQPPSLEPALHKLAKDGIPTENDIANATRMSSPESPYLLSDLWIPQTSDLHGTPDLLARSDLAMSSGSTVVLEAEMSGTPHLTVGFMSGSSIELDQASPLVQYDHLVAARKLSRNVLVRTWFELCETVVSLFSSEVVLSRAGSDGNRVQPSLHEFINIDPSNSSVDRTLRAILSATTEDRRHR